MPAAKSSLPAAKRRKTSHSSVIEDLEEKLKTSVNNQATLNPLVELISLASKCSEPQDLHKALYALYRIFVLLIDSGRFCSTAGEPEEAKIVRTWLNERFSEYATLLCKCLRHEQKAIRVSYDTTDDKQNGLIISIKARICGSFFLSAETYLRSIFQIDSAPATSHSILPKTA